mmetsp:Transcript_76780/g.151907  ORF Transcript_76780/g.151907 Transcript_76780/m.151907 type:complete len:275 (+) Transcript_76780:3-827(+)
MTKLSDEQALLEGSISTALQREVHWQTPVTSVILQKVYWAKALEQEALLEIVRRLVACIYGKNETIPITERMIIIREGLVAIKGRVLGRNEVYGESCMLLVTQHLVKEATPRTLSYATVLHLTRDQLREVCEAYPAADQRFRRAQIRTAVLRAFIHAAQTEQKISVRRCRSSVSFGASTSFEVQSQKRSFAATISATGFTAQDLMRVEHCMLERQQDLADRLDDIRENMDKQLNSNAQAIQELRLAIEQLRLASSGSSRFRIGPNLSPNPGTAR